MWLYIIRNWAVIHGLDPYTYKTYNFLLTLSPALKKKVRTLGVFEKKLPRMPKGDEMP
jgi:hypothetical protein